MVKGTAQWGQEVVLPAVIKELPTLLDDGASVSNTALAKRLLPILQESYPDVDTSVDRLRKKYIPEAKKRLKAANPDLIERIGDTLD